MVDKKAWELLPRSFCVLPSPPAEELERRCHYCHLNSPSLTLAPRFGGKPAHTCTGSSSANSNPSAATHEMRESIDTLRVRTAGFEGESVRLGRFQLTLADQQGGIDGRRVTFSIGSVPLAAGKHEKLPWTPAEQGAPNRQPIPTRLRNLRLTICTARSRESLRIASKELQHPNATCLRRLAGRAERLECRSQPATHKSKCFAATERPGNRLRLDCRS